MDQEPSVANSEQNSRTEPIEHQTHPESNNYEQSHGTPPPQKKQYEMKNDPALLFSPIDPPILHSKHSFSINDKF